MGKVQRQVLSKNRASGVAEEVPQVIPRWVTSPHPRRAENRFSLPRVRVSSADHLQR